MSTAESAAENVVERRGVFTPELLGRCISCGFCLPACPTYALTGVETSSRRGRVNPGGLRNALPAIGRRAASVRRFRTRTSVSPRCHNTPMLRL